MEGWNPGYMDVSGDITAASMPAMPGMTKNSIFMFRGRA
jgi:hypothetical protein